LPSIHCPDHTSPFCPLCLTTLQALPATAPLARSAPPLPPRTVYRHQESVAHQTVPCIASGRTRPLYRIGTSRASIGPGTTLATRAVHTMLFIKPGVPPSRDAYAYYRFRSTGAGMTTAGERWDAKQERKKTTRSSPRWDEKVRCFVFSFLPPCGVADCVRRAPTCSLLLRPRPPIYILLVRSLFSLFTDPSAFC
jgi:hypothetical protein